HIEFKGDLKKLFGQGQFAVATARGKIDVTGKAKVGAMDQNDINQIYWGQSQTSGGNFPYDEIHPPAVSVTPTQGSGLLVFIDQGVINGSTGLSMLRVPSAPAVGQYSFTAATTGGSPTAAVYAFNAAETAITVALSFLATSATGTSLTITNQLMGYAPVSQALLWNKFRGELDLLQLNAVTLGMLSKPTKQEDFWVADLDFSCNCDASGTLGIFYNS
ncbi:MAG: hypothetical protein M3O31_07070, partial [Acidobacteriota bacterium]|nr:hypothetical protein [Acidobacteriota bacterium]